LFGHLHHRALEVATYVSQRLLSLVTWLSRSRISVSSSGDTRTRALEVEIAAVDVVMAGVGWPRCLAREAKLFSSAAIPIVSSARLTGTER